MPMMEESKETVILYIVSQKTGPFLSRVSMITRDIDIANLSACLPVTFRYQMKTA